MSNVAIKRVLVANRGEIAIRIIRTLKNMDIGAVAIYETPDADSYHLRFADEAVHIGDGPNSDYLNGEKIITLAKQYKIDAIHPGCGFLSENADFAAACAANGIIFIGPKPETLRLFGDKLLAKKAALDSGAPILPCSEAILADERGFAVAEAFVQQYGYPVIIKSLFGGGGRGIRRVESGTRLQEHLRSASAEAKLSTNNPLVYVEKYIARPRHIEVQILADSQGRTMHLGTRDCSIQRRHQKLIEVAPASLPEAIATSIQNLSVKLASAQGYLGAGTVEFLFDIATQEIWFMEVNGRLQVEHTVTEMIVGVDIVEQQILAAAGKSLSVEEVVFDGIAIEVRINAEDPQDNFNPDGGKFIELYTLPGGPAIRVDSAIYKGYRVPSCYDSLLAKLIVKGYQWEQTVQRLKRSLSETIIAWPKTTIPLYLTICDEEDFKKRNYGTDYLETHPAVFDYSPHEYYIVDNSVYKTDCTNCAEEICPLGKTVACGKTARQHPLSVPPSGLAVAEQNSVKSTIKGKVARILVDLGDTVEAGDHLVELEAMKMHTYICAPQAGVVVDILFEEGDSVDVGSAIVIMK
ncbi:MAG: ATP-grasp domain-containing protein [Deltaproteobacteria bacterium]|nr:ATP-grasp domain-containing protein [Deltaproteobacteria bacterium]